MMNGVNGEHNAADHLLCPYCEASELRFVGGSAARCPSCNGLVAGEILLALRNIVVLPDAVGRHACDCGHPEMRLLPDGVYRCPACGSEVMPLDAEPASWKSSDRSDAYWSGWLDGRYTEARSFATNPRLSRWQDALERLDYYRGHRAGREARLARMQPAA